MVQGPPGQPGNGGYLGRHWRGDLPLSQSFWINGALVGAVGALVARVVADVALHVPAQPRTWPLWALLVLAAAMTTWQTVGIWRSAARRRRVKAGNLWPTLAQVAVAAGVLVTIVQAGSMAVLLTAVDLGRGDEMRVSAAAPALPASLAANLGPARQPDPPETPARHDPAPASAAPAGDSQLSWDAIKAFATAGNAVPPQPAYRAQTYDELKAQVRKPPAETPDAPIGLGRAVGQTASGRPTTLSGCLQRYAKPALVEAAAKVLTTACHLEFPGDASAKPLTPQEQGWLDCVFAEMPRVRAPAAVNAIFSICEARAGR